jgi:hypothetical protein
MKRFLRALCPWLCAALLSACAHIVSPSPTPALPIQIGAPAMAGFSITEKQRTDLYALLSRRTDAVHDNDAARFLSTVLPSDPILLKEEHNLILSASPSLTRYTLTADAAAPADGNAFLASLTQRYWLDGVEKHDSFVARFAYEEGALYYCGPAFSHLKRGAATVYFPAGHDDWANRLLNAQTETLESMRLHLGYTPTNHLYIKLYDSLETFLQSVKFDLPGWVGGWHEYLESTKCYLDVLALGGDSWYKLMLNHETTHHMISELSNDNAAYWLQEGLAGVFESLLNDFTQPYLNDDELRLTYTPFADHKRIDLESLGFEQIDAVAQYYASSKAYAVFLLDTYGWPKIRLMLRYMQRHPYLPTTAADKLLSANAYTDEALAHVLGIESDAQFQSSFDAWQTEKNRH